MVVPSHYPERGGVLHAYPVLRALGDSGGSLLVRSCGSYAEPLYSGAIMGIRLFWIDSRGHGREVFRAVFWRRRCFSRTNLPDCGGQILGLHECNGMVAILSILAKIMTIRPGWSSRATTATKGYASLRQNHGNNRAERISSQRHYGTRSHRCACRTGRDAAPRRSWRAGHQD